MAEEITMSKTNFGIMLIAIILGSILGTFALDQYLSFAGFGPSGLTISDEENIDLPARTHYNLEWRIEGNLDTFSKAGVNKSDTDGDNVEKLKEKNDEFEIKEYDNYIKIVVPLFHDYEDEDYLLTAYAVDTSGRVVSDEVIVDIYDPFFANIDGEFEDGEWQTINHHVQYIMPYNITAIILALFGEGSDDDIWDIEDVAITDYAFLDVYYRKNDGLFILYDWCFDLHNEKQNEGFGLWIDTDGDRSSLLNISEHEYETELNDGLEQLIYNSSDAGDQADLAGLITLNSSLAYTCARGFGKTAHSSIDHVFFEIYVPSSELRYGLGNYMSDYQYGVGGIGCMNMPGYLPIMFFMTPCITIPLAEATFYMCGTDAYDVNQRP